MSCYERYHSPLHVIEVNVCTKVVSTKILNHIFSKQALMDLSKECYDLYIHRLMKISDDIAKVGKQEYDVIHKALISLILSYDPISYSFAFTSEPSLHFFIRFHESVSLNLEIFLDLEDGNDTYVQLNQGKESILKLNMPFDDAIFNIKEHLDRIVKHSEIYSDHTCTT